jgi:phosphatidylethanolamine-binding protein (PEBP) family uncharacterized protein
MCVAARGLLICVLAAGGVLAGCGGGSSVRPPAPSISTGNGGGASTRLVPATTEPGAPGGGASEPSNANGQREHLPKVTIGVSIPVLLPKHLIPGRYTCAGADVSLPVHWSNLPRGTTELAMFLVSLKSASGKAFVNWAVAGLSPVLRGISAGTLPPGAIVGRNSFGNLGYSICPARGSPREEYVLRLVALAHPLSIRPGFDGRALYAAIERISTSVGVASGYYTRP